MSDTSAYDFEARRDTPLALKLKARICAEGPIRVHEYMSICLNDPEHGYYRHRAAIGRHGDFITAPEISQVFGELIGLWCVVVWRQMGMPDPFHLIELGPGRGTLMRDALRAAKLAPAFLRAVEVKLVETNVTLREQQRETLSGVEQRPTWYNTLRDVPWAPSIIIGNEFLDTVEPIQSVVTPEGVVTRGVGLDENGALQFTAMVARLRDKEADDKVGSIQETQTFDVVTDGFGLRSCHHPQAMLLIDYGDVVADRRGDTLQAVREHRFEHPLTSPGEADLSVQVDFARAACQMRVAQEAHIEDAAAFEIDGPVTQTDFLGALGIVERAQSLMQANPARANNIETGVARLIAPIGMGTRFKVMGVRSPTLPPLPGFHAART